MVCARCKTAVQSELEKAGLHPLRIELGEAEVEENLTQSELQKLDRSLQRLGFDIIDERKSKIIEKIKNSIVELVHHSEEYPDVNLSHFLSDALNHDYSYLSNLFSEVEGITIEKYVIAQKIERIKELLVYDELSISEIAERLGYSSAAYLSNQFKKSTGLTPTYFKSLKDHRRRNLDDL